MPRLRSVPAGVTGNGIHVPVLAGKGGQYAHGDGKVDLQMVHCLRCRTQATRPQRIVDVLGSRAIAAPLADRTFQQALGVNVQVSHKNPPWLCKEILFLLHFCYLVGINEIQDAEQLLLCLLQPFIQC